MTISRWAPALAALTAAFGAARTLAAQTMAVRPLGAIEHASVLIPSIDGIRVLSDGRVLVNDDVSHSVTLWDRDLRNPAVVADTTSDTHKAYGSKAGMLFPYFGDSTLFVDQASRAMVIVDPQGHLGRTIALPGPAYMTLYATNVAYEPAWDPRGALLYRGGSPSPAAKVLKPGTSGTVWSDSSTVVRIDLNSHTTDTVARLHIFRASYYGLDANGRVTSSQGVISPFTSDDDWTILPDGTLAIVRVSDFHIDWIGPDGARRSTPRIAHEWVRISDSAKSALVDSMRRSDSTRWADELAAMDRRMAAVKAGLPDPDPPRSVTTLMPDGTIATGTFGRALGPLTRMEPRFVSPDDLPDYFPPFTSFGAVLADADGNVWIRERPLVKGTAGSIFSVVNRAGVLVDRVQIPGGTNVVGFGPGVVYLDSKVSKQEQLARARIR